MKTSKKPKKPAARKATSPAKAGKKSPKPAPAKTVKTPKKAAKSAPSKKPAAGKMAARRADYGAPIEGFFAKQQPHLRPILEELRTLVEEAAPEAIASIKWGMPFYVIGREMMCALAGFKSHVNLILSGPPGTFADPAGLLEGEAKVGRHLKLRAINELPREAVRAWLRTAAQAARQRGAEG